MFLEYPATDLALEIMSRHLMASRRCLWAGITMLIVEQPVLPIPGPEELTNLHGTLPASAPLRSSPITRMERMQTAANLTARLSGRIIRRLTSGSTHSCQAP